MVYVGCVLAPIEIASSVSSSSEACSFFRVLHNMFIFVVPSRYILTQ